MTQIARPASDITLSTWTAVPGSPATLWDKLDEVVPDDAATAAETTITGAGNDQFEVKLAPLTDPAASSGHTVRVRAFADDGLGDGAAFNAFLFQGATQIATFSFSAGAAWITGQYTLTSIEADSITDYTDLRVRLKATGSVGNTFIFDVSQIEFQVPSPVVPPFYDIFLWARPDE